jgi:peptidoglycan hydrolase-like protein with peptidoglycan-binding domain
MRRHLHTALAALVAVLVAGTLAVALPGAPTVAAGKALVERAQKRLDDLHCGPGRPDGRLDDRTRSAIIRFQSRHHLPVNGHLTDVTRTRLYADDAHRCDVRPVPRGSGSGRRIVISQRQNWVWLVGPRGQVQAQQGMVDWPSALSKGWHATGSYCGRPARVQRNSSVSGTLWLMNFVRFAPCGVGFHRIPIYKSTGRQMHPDWYLGTNLDQSHGCIRLSREMSRRVWEFTADHRTRVRVL